jgi:hypothetical protein
MQLLIDPPPPTRRLDVASAGRASAKPGVYAAWICDPDALASCGVAGPAPRLIYVGKASGRGGLRARLLRHARTPFWSLVDLLGARGTIRPGWWQYAIKHQRHSRSLHAPPLAAATERAALAWQHEHLVWGWVPIADAGTVESALIAAHEPLLNLRGRGYVRR